MNKESIIAIVLGLVLGIVVAVAAVSITVSRQKAKNSQIQKTESTATAGAQLQTTIIPPTVTVLQSLQIDAPQSGIITQDKSATIKGNAGANTLLVVQSPIKTTINKLDKATFSIDFPLALGENVITVSAYHEGASVPVQKKLYIYRLTL